MGKIKEIINRIRNRDVLKSSFSHSISTEVPLEVLLEQLQISPALIDLVLERVEIPNNVGQYSSVDNYWYPHPPVLVPFFLDSGSYYRGVLKHFFCSRQVTFVDYSLEVGHFWEKARSSKQFITELILDIIMLEDGLSATIVDFFKQIDFKEYNEIDTFTLTYGNIPEYYDKLINFEVNTPLIYVKSIEQYDGDFPSTERLFNKAQVYNACSFEIANQMYLEDIVDLPDWLKPKVNQQELFKQYIIENKLKEAWLTLNSTGWELGNVREALCLLKTKTDDKLFHLVADRWINRFELSTWKIDDVY
ncbi:MAG: hypothetical protein LBE34_11150 [Flavobacteriaceae bacterium]|jgi:hypothetical protein|nr:hypothetical protein [Flavobacteriaceae bacterium]